MFAAAFHAVSSALAPLPPLALVRRDSRGMAAEVQALSSYGGSSGLETPRDYASAQRLYDSLVAVYRCATLNASAVAAGRLRFYRDEDGEAVELPRDHPLPTLFRRPNPRMSTREFLWRNMVSKELTGNAYAELARGRTRGPVAQLWPLNSAHMKIVPDQKLGEGGYIQNAGGGARAVRYEADEVWHDYYPDPNHELYGVSPLRALARTVAADIALENALGAILRNGVRLSGVLMVDKDAGEVAVEAAVKMLRANYAGPENAGKPLVIAGGKKWEQMQLTPAEFEALATRRWNREQILEAFGVWPLMYGIVDQSATRENATTQRKLYYELTVLPRAQMLCDEMSEGLIPRLGIPGTDGVYCTIDFSDTPLERELATDDARANAALTRDGIMTINEIRRSLGEDPVPWGDEWWGTNMTTSLAGPGYGINVDSEFSGENTSSTALNGAQVASATAIVQAVADGRIPRDSGIGQIMIFFNLTRAEAEAIMGSTGDDFVPAPPPSPGVNPALADDGGDVPDANKMLPDLVARASSLAQRLVDAVTLERDVAGTYVERSGSDDVRDAIDAGRLDADDEALRRLRTVFRDAVAEGGDAALADLGVDVDFDADTPAMRRWLEQKTIRFADATWDTSSDALRASLLEGLKAGESAQDMAARVDAVFDGRKDNALTVARTETAGTQNRGVMEAYAQAGVEEQSWLTAQDGHVRDSHAEIDGETVALGEPFSNGLEFPGDTDHGGPEDFANCRCTLSAVISGAEKATTEARAAHWRAFDGRLSKTEQRVARQWARICDEQRARVKAALAERLGAKEAA